MTWDSSGPSFAPTRLFAVVAGGAGLRRRVPIGSFLTGTVAEHWRVTTALVVNGTVGLVATGAVLLWSRARRGVW